MDSHDVFYAPEIPSHLLYYVFVDTRTHAHTHAHTHTHTCPHTHTPARVFGLFYSVRTLPCTHTITLVFSTDACAVPTSNFGGTVPRPPKSPPMGAGASSTCIV